MKESIRFNSISHSISVSNEDLIGFTDNTGWILDGATSISGRRKKIEGRIETDASWFVRRFSEEMKIQTNKINIDAVMQAKLILTKLRTEAQIEWGDWHEDVPSSSFTHININSGIAKFTNLGDCRLLYQVDCGPIASFGSSEVALLDLALLKEYQSIRKDSDNVSHSMAWNAVVPTIRKNRNHMNTNEGYWILSPDGSGLNHAEQISIQYQKKLRVLMATDGLYRLVDTYNQLDMAAFFEQAFETNGLKTLLKQLRDIELKDLNSITYPRVKLQDDATALIADISI